jgi:hypothetical protein
MRYNSHEQGGGIVRHAEPRHSIDLSARMIVDEGQPFDARLTNLSRHGFRLTLPHTFPAGLALRLEVEGWPRLRGQVVWSQGGRTGCLFEEPPSHKTFAMMCSATTGQERDAF